jgi:hypothetical protein
MTSLRRFLSISITLCVIGFPFSIHAKTPDEDFAERCHAPGVVTCIGFDNTSTDIVKNKNLSPDGLGVFRGGLDTEVKASGAGSLVFALPPPPHAGANIAGAWTGPSSAPALGQTFSQNSTFYLQYRVRFSPEIMTNTWPANNSWKVAVLFYSSFGCAPLDLVMGNLYRTGIVAANTDCGSFGLVADPATGKAKRLASPPLLMQQGDYNCAYGNYNPTDCFYLVPNEWLTFYYRVSLGTWGQPNSIVQIWVQREGQAGYKQIVNISDYKFDCDTAPCDQSPGKDQGFNNIEFTPYMTGLDPNAGLPGVTSKVWYDEMIVSTQPIAAPTFTPTVTSAAVPAAPMNLTLH